MLIHWQGDCKKEQTKKALTRVDIPTILTLTITRRAFGSIFYPTRTK